MFQGHGKIIIFGHYGGHNTGDDAMLTGLLWAVSPFFEQIVVLTKDDSLPQTAPERARALRAGVREFLRELPSARAIILGGGTHFHDDYTVSRYIRHVRYMLRIIGVSVIAKAYRKRVLWLSMGFGPFFRPVSRLMTMVGMLFCDAITVRDKVSLGEATRMALRNNVFRAFDLAALLLEKAQPCRHKIPGLIGICVTSTTSSLTGGRAADKMFWERVSRALLLLLDEHSIRLRIFIFRGGNRENDIGLSFALYQKLKQAHPERVEIVPYDPDPFNTFNKVAECEAFIATRLHSAVLAYLAGCRLLALAYHRKVADFAKEIKLPHRAVLNCGMTVSEQDLAERFRELVNGSPKYQANLPIGEAVRRSWTNIQVLLDQVGAAIG